MSGSTLTALTSQEFVDRLITPVLVVIGIFAILSILGYDLTGLLGGLSPSWAAILVFGYLGFRLVHAVEGIAESMDASD